MIKRKVITNNREIYNKFNNLNFTNEIILKDVKLNQIKKILNNINKYEKILTLEKIENYFLIKKNKPLNFNIYIK